MADFLGNGLLQAVLPKIVKENVEVAAFFALLSYVLFLVNWLVTTDWLEKVRARRRRPARSSAACPVSSLVSTAQLHLFSAATCAIGGKHSASPWWQTVVAPSSATSHSGTLCGQSSTCITRT